MWKAAHDDFQQQIVGYEVGRRDTVGQTTTAVVQFNLRNRRPTCITLTVDEHTQRIWMDRGYTRCTAHP